MLDSRLKNAILITVTSVWAANFLAGLIPAFKYHPDQTINGIFMGIVGGVFALSARQQDTSDRKEVLPKKETPSDTLRGSDE